MIMAYSNSNTKVVPEAREALDKFKYEVASESVSYTHLRSSGEVDRYLKKLKSILEYIEVSDLSLIHI